MPDRDVKIVQHLIFYQREADAVAGSPPAADLTAGGTGGPAFSNPQADVQRDSCRASSANADVVD